MRPCELNMSSVTSRPHEILMKSKLTPNAILKRELKTHGTVGQGRNRISN